MEQTTAEIAAYIRQENNDNDYTDRAFDLLSNLAESVQEDFEVLTGINSDKEKFIGALPKIFALLLNANVSCVEKIKTIKMAIDTTLKIWQEPRQQWEDFRQRKGAKENEEDHLK